MLTHLFPRPTSIRLSDATWRALPLRIRDLVDLEALAINAAPNVWQQPPDGDLDDPEYRAALRAMVDAAERYVGGWCSDWCATVVFGTQAGMATVLTMVLRRHRLTFEECMPLASAATVEEWEAVQRVAFGACPLQSAIDRVDREIGLDTFAESGVPIVKAIVETWQATGLPLKAIYNLTIPAFRTIRAGGEPQNPWGITGEEAPITENSGNDPQARRRGDFYADRTPLVGSWKEWAMGARN